MAFIYRIQNKDGLYSTGGSYPRWKKTGKTWTTKAALSNHLGVVRYKDVYKDAFVITYEVAESAIGEVPVEQALQEKADRKAKVDAERQARFEEQQRQYRLAEYERLRKEFG